MTRFTRFRTNERPEARPARPGAWLFIGLLASLGGFAGLIFALPILTVSGLLMSLLAITCLSHRIRRVLQSRASDHLDELAHELRGPIATIRGYAESFDREDPTHNDTSIEAIQRTAAFVGRLIDRAFDANPPTPSPPFVDLHRLIDDVTAIHQHVAQTKNIVFCVDIASNIPERAGFDGDLWRQVIGNLLDNAVKFTTHGSVTLGVAFDDGLLVATISDTGCGIAKEDVPSVFRPFARLQTEAIAGKGLGLHVAQRLARDLGGAIHVESTLGEGSIFALSCPLLMDGVLDGWHLLIVDDCPLQRRLLSRHLRGACEGLLEASSGEEAVKTVRSTPVDAVILDLQLTGIDGFKTSQTLRMEGFTGTILGVSAHVTVPRTKRALAAGIDCLIQKPISRNDLLAALRTALAHQTRARNAG